MLATLVTIHYSDRHGVHKGSLDHNRIPFSSCLTRPRTTVARRIKGRSQKGTGSGLHTTRGTHKRM